MMMPLNPLAAKFSKWSSDEEEEDAFGGTGFGGPFGAPLSLNRSVDLGRDDSITPEVGCGAAPAWGTVEFFFFHSVLPAACAEPFRQEEGLWVAQG